MTTMRLHTLAALLLFPVLATPFLGCAAPAQTHEVSSTTPLPSVSLQLQDLDGRALDLEQELSAGKHVALVFWQTYCASCRREAPELIDAHALYGSKIRFVGVVPGGHDVVEPDEIRATAREWGLPYAIVQDTELALTKAYGIQGTPTLIVLGENGKVLYKGAHVPDWNAFL